jgi:hypothetical protein
LLSKQDISEVLFKLVGDIHPIQDTNYDKQVLQNQETLIYIVDKCVEELLVNADRRDIYARSVKEVADKARDFLLDISNYIQDYMDGTDEEDEGGMIF